MLYVAATRAVPPSRTSLMIASGAPHSVAAASAIVVSTVWRSVGELAMTRSTLAVAVWYSSASASAVSLGQLRFELCDPRCVVGHHAPLTTPNEPAPLHDGARIARVHS